MILKHANTTQKCNITTEENLFFIFFFGYLTNQTHTFDYNYETRFLIWQFTWANEETYACDFKHN